MRYAALLWLMCSVGCMSVVEYMPNSNRIEEIGRVNAVERLKEVISKGIRPEILFETVEITGVLLQYQVDTGPTGVRWIQIVWTEMGKVVLYKPNASSMTRDHAPESRSYIVEIQRPDGGEHSQILFHGIETARTYVDLIESFRQAAVKN